MVFDGRSEQPRDGADTARPTAGGSPDALFGEVDRLGGLVREIGRLVEDALRGIVQARTSLARLGPELLASQPDVGQAGEALAHAGSDLERTAELVHAAMNGPGLTLGSPLLVRARPVTLGEAIRHAADVLASAAARTGVGVEVVVEPEVEDEPAGAIYTVVLNGIQNGIEAVARRGGAGRVRVEARRGAVPDDLAYGRDDRVWCDLTIRDEGAGLPTGVSTDRLFDLGFTTKRGGTGVGLAVARNVVRQMGGDIRLVPRDPGVAGLRSSGVDLIVRVPLPTRSTLRLGGAA